MRTARISALLIAGALSTAAHAASIDAVLPLDTQTSHLSFSLTLNGQQVASASVPFIGGTFDATIEQTGTSPPPLNLTNVSGDVNAGPFAINTVLGNLSTKGLSLALGPDAGPFLTNGLNPAQVNLAGLPVSLDAGTISALGFQLVNFAHTPVNFTLGSTVATLDDTVMSLSVPVNTSGTDVFGILGHQITVGFSLTGAVNFSGPVAAIPEPSSILLLGVGGLAIVGVRRWRR